MSDRPVGDRRARGQAATESSAAALIPAVANSIGRILSELDQIPDARRETLARLTEFVTARGSAGQPALLTFICTHNSRRSQMAQIWARTAACHFGLSTVEAYSGGTEATHFDPRAVAAIRRAGFAIDGPSGGDTPVYRARYSEGAEPMECFSKIYDASPNPTEGFAAVMTCGAADVACPIVRGAVERISLPYDDPRDFDGTVGERDAYDERCRQIAREMLYAFSLVRR